MMDSVHTIRRKHRRAWGIPLLCLLALLLMIGLLGCNPGRSDEPGSTAQPEQTSGEVTEPETDLDGQPTTDPATTPDGQPTTDPATTPDGQPTTDPATTPDGQPTTDPATTPDSQPTTDPATTPDDQPTTDPATTPDGQPTTDPATDSDSQPTTDPGTEPDDTTPIDPHPGDASAWEGLMIDQVYGTGKKATDAALSHGYIQLYNASSQSMSLSGVSLYYSDGEKAYRALVLPTDAVIPAGGCYLIRANSPTDYDESTSIVSLTEYDLEWNVYIDNKEVRLLLAPSGWTLDVTDDITAFEDAISVFFASETVYNGSIYAVDDLSKNKVAIRTARTDYSGYHTVNLTRASSSLLERICTSTSAGKTNDTLRPRISEVTFSHAAGLYDSSVNLTLTGPDGYNIYYTTDGSDPTTSSTRKKYTGAVLLTDSGEMAWGSTIKKWNSKNGGAVPTSTTLPGGYVIKAYATNSIESTAVFTNTYFIGADLEQYDVPIVSLSIPLDEMLGSNGFYSNYCPTGVITDKRPRGTAIMEVFDPDGGRVGNSRVELAVSGNGSSGWAMKSLRIYYKGALNKEAGLESDLNYDIFGGLATDANGQAITSFSRLLLRNSGNDCNTSFIRDAYMQRACSVLNIDTMASASTLVFVNGEFWGVYNMRERYSPEYVESHYGVNKDSVVVIESDYSQVHTNTNADFVLSAGLEGDEKPFNDLVQYIREHDLADQAAYDYVASQIDIDSFTDMWVARLFFVARDWPENNIKIWRNKDENDPSGVDTKWHFVMLDMDMGLSFYTPSPSSSVNTTETENFFWAFSSNSVCGAIMRGLMNNAAYKQQFILRYYEVFTDIFTPEYLSDLFEELYVERDALMPLQVKRWGNSGASVSTWRSAADLIRSFINNRQAIGLRHMYSYFGISESDIENATKKRIGFSFSENRVSVSCNGTAVTMGDLLWLDPDDQTQTLTIQATAQDGYTLTSIVWIGKDGTTQTVSVSGTTGNATFTVTGSGTISVYAKSTSSGESGTTPTTPIEAIDINTNGSMSADTYFENNENLKDGGAHEWLAENRPNGIGGVATVAFRGWAFVTGETTKAFGYVLDDGGMENIVWNSFVFETRKDVAKSFECDAATVGYKITVSLADVPAGEHTLCLLLKTETGIYELSQWGNIRVIGSGIGDAGQRTTTPTLVAGATYLFYLDENGDLYAWGDNSNGALGLNSAQAVVSKPTLVMQGVAKVATSQSGDFENGHTEWMTAILTTDGKLYTVGSNGSGQLGRNGTVSSDTLGLVSFAGEIADISVGHDHLLVLDTNGVLWGVGNNSYGQLNTIGSSTTTFVKVAEGVTQMSAGRRVTLYVDVHGTLYGLGDNRWNKLVAGGSSSLTTPTKLLTNVAFISSGEHECVAITNTGDLYYAGWRTVTGFAQGAGNDPAFQKLMSGVSDASIYYADMVILTSSGDAYVYGSNTDGCIGSAVVNGTPKKLLSGDIVDAVAGNNFTAYLYADGSIRVKGNNAYGQAGTGKTGGTASLTPIYVS